MNGPAALATAALWLLQSTERPESYLGLHTALPAFVEEGEAEDPDVAPGLVVVAVVENSPAEQARFAVGDRVLRVGGVAPRTPAHLEAMIAELPVSSEVSANVRRGAAVFELRATTVARLLPREMPHPVRMLEARRFGVALATLNGAETLREGVDPGDGVRIERLLEGGAAGRGGLDPGDIIHRVDGEPVHGPADFIALADRLEPGAAVEIVLSRQGLRRTLSVRTRGAATRLKEVSIPPILSFSDDPARDEVSFGLLLGLLGYRQKEKESQFRLLWFITFTTGTNEELEEVDAR